MQCPSCDLPTRTELVCGEPLDRCDACGGEFCTHPALRRLLAAHATLPGSSTSTYTRPSPLCDPMRYRKCPTCGGMMLRKNFKESSGIVVDVCSAHGIWFDQGELGMVFEFATTGALATAERDAMRRVDSRRRLDAYEQRLRDAGPRHYLGSRLTIPVDGLADIATLVLDLDD